MAEDNTYIRFDWAIKHILLDKANFGILEGLVSVLLNEEIKIEEILESESNQEHSDDKFNRVDIKAKNSKGHIILIEVQLTNQLDYMHRILYGTCKTITEHMRSGRKYEEVKKVYSISILYCEYGHGDDYVYHGQTVFKGIHTGNNLQVNIREEGTIVPRFPGTVFPEYYLIRVNQYTKIPETPLDEWIDYLKTGMVKEDTRTPGLKEVKEKLRILSMTTEEKRDYDRHMDAIATQESVFETARLEGKLQGSEEGMKKGRAEGIAQGREEGRAEGIAQGREEGKMEMVRMMLAGGISPDKIKEITGICVRGL